MSTLLSPVTDIEPEHISKQKGLVTWTIFFSGVGKTDSVSSELRKITGTSNPNLQDMKQSVKAVKYHQALLFKAAVVSIDLQICHII